jgi:hypothetical protein
MDSVKCNDWGRRGMAHPASMVLWVVMLAVGTVALPRPVRAQDCDFSAHGQCTATSRAALRACRNETRDGFWIAVGNCRNLSEGRSDCIDEARGERDSAFDDCDEQCSARQDICGAIGQAPYDPTVDPANFVAPAAIAANPNPYWPLIPGTTWRYEGESEVVTVTVTEETTEILGVTCVEVHDVAEEDGEVIEDTLDWYAQDQDGNVWYFGELSQQFDGGLISSLEGSWTAGVESAKPGIVMKADPQVGDAYRQEFFLGDAEDFAEVTSVTGDDEVPAASCDGACLVTEETTPIEPDLLEDKYYLAGVGLVLEVDLVNGERTELVEVTMAP